MHDLYFANDRSRVRSHEYLANVIYDQFVTTYASKGLTIGFDIRQMGHTIRSKACPDEIGEFSDGLDVAQDRLLNTRQVLFHFGQ